MTLFRRLLAGSEFSTLASLVSPALLDLITPREISARAVQLARNWSDHEGYRTLLGARQRLLTAQGVELILSPVEPPRRSLWPFRHHEPHPGPPPRGMSGEAALGLFFQQIFAGSGVLLDFRRSRFAEGEGGRLSFRPLPLWTTWQQDFQHSLRDMYQGFYEEDDALIARALRYLGLSVAKDVLVRTFGGAHRTACRFSVEASRVTFHEVFLRCRDHHAPVHPDLLVLGILMLTLTDHLEDEGEAYDVRSLCARARKLELPSAARVY